MLNNECEWCVGLAALGNGVARSTSVGQPASVGTKLHGWRTHAVATAALERF